MIIKHAILFLLFGTMSQSMYTMEKLREFFNAMYNENTMTNDPLTGETHEYGYIFNKYRELTTEAINKLEKQYGTFEFEAETYDLGEFVLVPRKPREPYSEPYYSIGIIIKESKEFGYYGVQLPDNYVKTLIPGRLGRLPKNNNLTTNN